MSNFPVFTRMLTSGHVCKCLCVNRYALGGHDTHTYTHSLTLSENPEGSLHILTPACDKSERQAEKVRDCWYTFTRIYNHQPWVMVVWLSCRELIALERNSNLILLKMTPTFPCLFLGGKFSKTSLLQDEFTWGLTWMPELKTPLCQFAILDSISMQ